MKRILAASLVVLAVVALAAFAGRTQSASAKPTAGSLVGTGATFPFPLISKWIPAVDDALGIKITYSATGSGAGIAQITARTVDFGASDAPLSPDQLAACKGCVVIPWALAGMSVPYNLPGVGKRLEPQRAGAREHLPRQHHELERGGDQGAEPRREPARPRRSRRSTAPTAPGSTYAFTNYLSTVSPQWKSKVGKNTSVNFPAGTGARGSAGVAGVVKSTEGALTYVDAAYSIQNKFQFALIQNRAGGNRDARRARRARRRSATLPAKVTNLAQLKIVDPPQECGKKAYPISTFTYVIVPTSSGDKAADLRKFVYWAVTAGQKFGPPLFFVPLPKAVNGFIYREIKKIQAGS